MVNLHSSSKSSDSQIEILSPQLDPEYPGCPSNGLVGVTRSGSGLVFFQDSPSSNLACITSPTRAAGASHTAPYASHPPAQAIGCHIGMWQWCGASQNTRVVAVADAAKCRFQIVEPRSSDAIHALCDPSLQKTNMPSIYRHCVPVASVILNARGCFSLSKLFSSHFR